MKRRGFLGALLAAGGSAACASAPPPLPVSTPDPSVFDSCRRDGTSFTILTWNIWMMPQWTGASPRNEPRAAAIAATLLEQDFDILCLQKVFDADARYILEKSLAAKYPFRFGPANDRCGLKINSGVWVLSRFPLTDYRSIEFDDCIKIECMSRKGAVLLTGSCAGAPFQLVTAHLQGEEGSKFTEQGQRTRDKQMAQMHDELIRPNTRPKVPFLICGDFGTPRFTGHGLDETSAYHRMLSTFSADNGAQPRVTLAECNGYNDIAENTGRCNELDYVLVSPNGRKLTIERTVHAFRRYGWDDTCPERVDLSYRWALSARVTMG